LVKSSINFFYGINYSSYPCYEQQKNYSPPANNSFGAEPVKLALFEGWGEPFDRAPGIRKSKIKANNKGYRDGINAAESYVDIVLCKAFIHTSSQEFRLYNKEYLEGFAQGFRERFAFLANLSYDKGYVQEQNETYNTGKSDPRFLDWIFKMEGIRQRSIDGKDIRKTTVYKKRKDAYINGKANEILKKLLNDKNCQSKIEANPTTTIVDVAEAIENKLKSARIAQNGHTKKNSRTL
jgi:hypothetical protein